METDHFKNTKEIGHLESKVTVKIARVVMIKSVLNNLSLYYMSIHKIPKGVVTRIIELQCHFFWQGSSNNKRLLQIKWSIVQKPKALGGLGIDDFVVNNAGLLFKWWWCFFDEGNPLWKRTICSTPT